MAKKPYNGGSSSLADFKQLSLLGEGAYSAVYKVLRLADREIYALKKVKLPSLSDKEKQNALNEVRLLASVRHENIIAYKEAFFDDKTRCLCIVTEFADSGDLFMQITKCQKERQHPKEADVWRYLSGMCHGLKALHDMRILHRDLKCANIFLGTDPDTKSVIAKLGDFNVSKVAKRGLCMTQTGTPYYASPEVWRDMPYDAKSDMWSLGCVLYELVALRPPFRAEDMEGLYRKVLRGQYPRIPAHFSNDLSEVIGVLLQVNPRHRPSIEQFLQMPSVLRHADMTEPEHRPADLLSTIKLPKNAIDLSGCLPGPQYDIEMGFRYYDPVPPSQESAGDVAGGTAKLLPAMRLPGGGRGAQLTPQSEVEATPKRAENRGDSLDAYLSSPQGPSQGPGPDRGYPGPVHRAAPPAAQPPSSQGYHQSQAQPPLHHQQPSSGLLPQLVQDKPERDSLDNYVQRQRPPRQQRPLASEYGDHNAEDSLPRRHAASPAPSSHVRGPPIYARQPAYNDQPNYGVQQYRHPHQRTGADRDRRPMASYARAQYALGSGPGSQVQASPPRQPTSERRQATGGGLRLPRIFTKA